MCIYIYLSINLPTFISLYLSRIHSMPGLSSLLTHAHTPQTWSKATSGGKSNGKTQYRQQSSKSAALDRGRSRDTTTPNTLPLHHPQVGSRESARHTTEACRCKRLETRSASIRHNPPYTTSPYTTSRNRPSVQLASFSATHQHQSMLPHRPRHARLVVRLDTGR